MERKHTSVVLTVWVRHDDGARRYLDPELVHSASSHHFKYLPLYACLDDKGE